MYSFKCQRRKQMNKKEFDAYLEKTSKEIKEKYEQFALDGTELYLTITISRDKNSDKFIIDCHNNYWELPKEYQVKYWENN